MMFIAFRNPALRVVLLVLAPCVCGAQTLPSDGMPDGSADRYFGLGVAVGPAYEGSRTSLGRLVFDGHWERSNGTFGTVGDARYDPLHPIQLGYRFAPSPAFAYGPMIALREDWPTFVARQASTRNELVGMAGGFVDFNLTDELKLTGNLLVDMWSSQGSGNALGNLDLRQTSRIGVHHTVALWGGLRWGDGRAARNEFGVTAAQSVVAGFPVYEARAGIEDLHVGANWRWDLTNAWSLSTSGYLAHLTASAAGSPEVQRRDNNIVSVTLLRRF